MQPGLSPVAVNIVDLEQYQALAQRPITPLTEVLSVRIDANLHRVLQKLVSREDMPFTTTSDLARYAIELVCFKLADAVRDRDITMVLGQTKLLMDRAMEQRVISQWAETVVAIRANLQSAMADLDHDAIYDTMESATGLVEMIGSKVWRSRLARLLAKDEVVQAAVLWLWMHWGERGEDKELVKKARGLTRWLEESVQ